ncbi:histidine kinase [Bacillus coahuilensis p1.1.43]|uniref:Signal transduction histidine-protein kinase/phosphatase DegS n=1 Tax=Bacillus coahuilensis p1.1.43 TaxID=1150625 RepID=A0A147K4L4_9BACI|nr:sensor histidine kinase [Bacillus coahuilensis]KUP04376.1 histidine kinase [Bacillus coahuilensis p1.1.43]
MSFHKVDKKVLDNILEKMVDAVSKSKDDVFHIEEQCRSEYDDIHQELLFIREKVNNVIDQGDDLESKARLARNRLSQVSHSFKEFSEEQVRQAYETAHDLQMQLSMNRHQELQLRNRRDELERRLYSLEETIERAEQLVSQITVVLNYLSSDIREMSQALEDAKMKQEFGFRIIEAQEDERKRLSREIHDGPAQMMANVLMRTDLAEKVYKEHGPEVGFSEIREMKQMVRSALYEVRRIIYDLRPMALDDLGLIPTLKKYLHTLEDYHAGVVITFQNMGQEKRLPSKFEVALFRMVQESVNNALKHAQPTEIQVKIEIKKEKVLVIVKDNGKGFDTENTKQGSFGIMGMKERVELLNGTLSILSKIDVGTAITIEVPLP